MYEPYLVHDIPGCAARIRELLEAPEAGEAHGHAGWEHVRARFLLPRLVRDNVALAQSLV